MAGIVENAAAVIQPDLVAQDAAHAGEDVEVAIAVHVAQGKCVGVGAEALLGVGEHARRSALRAAEVLPNLSPSAPKQEDGIQVAIAVQVS